MSVVDLRAFVSHGPDGAVVICLDGNLDATTADSIQELIATAIEAGGERVILDLRDVAAIDADGLAAVASAERRARGAGGSVHVRSLSKRAVDLMLMTGLDGSLVIDGPPLR